MKILLVLVLVIGTSCRSTTSDTKVIGGALDTSSTQVLRYYLIRDQDGKKVTLGACTGSFYTKTQMITAAHCFDEANANRAGLIIEGKKYLSKNVDINTDYTEFESVLWRDPSADIAIITFDTKDLSLTTVKIGKPAKIKEPVKIVGYGVNNDQDPKMFLEWKRFSGPSSIRDIFYSSGKYRKGVIELATFTKETTDQVTVSRGDSGGTLFNQDGEAIGIFSQGIPRLSNEQFEELTRAGNPFIDGVDIEAAIKAGAAVNPICVDLNSSYIREFISERIPGLYQHDEVATPRER